MKIVVNGEPCEVSDGSSLADFILQFNLGRDRIAVERNGDIVRRDNFASTLLVNDDTLEIVRFVGGG